MRPALDANYVKFIRERSRINALPTASSSAPASTVRPFASLVPLGAVMDFTLRICAATETAGTDQIQFDGERGSGSGALAALDNRPFGGSDLNIKLKQEPGPKVAWVTKSAMDGPGRTYLPTANAQEPDKRTELCMPTRTVLVVRRSAAAARSAGPVRPLQPTCSGVQLRPRARSGYPGNRRITQIGDFLSTLGSRDHGSGRT